MSRKIKIEALDPTGFIVETSPYEIEYTNLGYANGRRLPEDYPISMFGTQEEPMRQVRYKLTVGDYEYMVNRKGQIIDCFNSKNFSIDY